MNKTDKVYFQLLNKLLNEGKKKEDRTGTGTISLFGHKTVFDMKDGFPLLTSKKMFTKGIIHELVWFLRGDTNIKYLVENGVNIWNGDAYKYYVDNFKPKKSDPLLSKSDFIERIKIDDLFAEHWGELGPVYGAQWRDAGGTKELEITNERDENGYLKFKKVHKKGVDQFKKLIDDLNNNPDSRRLIVNSWNALEIDNMVLPPCHYLYQCYTYEMSLNERCQEWCNSLCKDISYAEDMTHERLDDIDFPRRKLSLMWNQRSCDVPLGLPFNIASYAILLHLIGREVNMIPHELVFNGADCHIYLNQLDNQVGPVVNYIKQDKELFSAKWLWKMNESRILCIPSDCSF